MSARYIIERWPHGWLLCGAKGVAAIPMNALSECSKLFPRTAIIATNIPHHFHATGRSEVVMCIVDAGAEHQQWCTEIAASIASLPPRERWWKGLDVGMSSAALFAVFSGCFGDEADRMGMRSTPRDSDDFGRCSRLLALFPEWRASLHRVAEAYPETKWPAIIARWDEIERAAPAEQTAILGKI